MSLIHYWPSHDEINRCIKAEAESASDAVLLAVHQSMPLLRKDVGSDVEAKVSEHDLLEAFLTKNLPQGTLLMPITGASGAGKSHLIRWLSAQLGRDPRAKHMHVIRIPKSASLRDVVERVLEPLSSDPRYREVQESLSNAMAEVNEFDAAVHFRGALQIELKELGKQLVNALQNCSSDSERRKLQHRAHHAQQLPNYLNDASLGEYMIEHVLSPIIMRALKGRAELAAEEEESLPQFSAEDLKLPDEMLSGLGQAARSVQTYHNTLQQNDGAGYVMAAEVLNLRVDQAIRKVFRLDQATGGITLEEIILRVRELLLEEQRELVLLIEDFAALSGIQEVLLSVCIQESERDGQQVRSRMRTALALTDGYLVARDTITTRAMHEWVIQASGAEADIFRRTATLTAAYLNAARWGEQELKRQYRQSAKESENDLTGWTRTFHDDDCTPEDSEQLKAFGEIDVCGQAIPLFPYNDNAIVQLARRHLRDKGELRFDPRKILNFIVRPILLDGRDAFEQGNFPPTGFEGARPSAGISSWLGGLAIPAQERERLKALLFYWGNNPNDPAQVSLPPEIYKAFGVALPSGLTIVESNVVPPQNIPIARPSPELEPNVPLPEDTRVEQWRQTLEAWAGGTELGQGEARKLRNILASGVEKAIPWESLRLSKKNINIGLTIPNARGNPTSGFTLKIADDHSDPDGELRHTLLGAIRLGELFKGTNYPDEDEDSARVATMTDRLVAQLIPLLEQKREQEVPVLSWMLRRQGRVLGLLPRARKPHFDLELEAVRASIQDQQPPGDENDRWQQLKHDAAKLRVELQQALWDRIGCFQGTTGGKVYAIDPTLLVFNDKTDGHVSEWLTATQKEHYRQLTNRLPQATRPLIDKLRKVSERFDKSLGADGDKQQLLSVLGNLIDNLQNIGVWPPDYNRPQVKRDIESFRNDDIKKQLDEASALVKTDAEVDFSSDSTLERLGRLDRNVIERSDKFLQMVDAFVKATERSMDAEEKVSSGCDPARDAEKLEQKLKLISQELSEVIGGQTL